MIQRRQRLGVYEIIGQLRIAKAIAPHLHGVIYHLFFGAAAVFLQHFARVAIGKYRLDPRADIARIQADCAGWRNRGQQRIANAMGGDGGAHIFVHRLHRARGQIFLGIKQRERAFFFRQLDRGQIGRACNGL